MFCLQSCAYPVAARKTRRLELVKSTAITSTANIATAVPAWRAPGNTQRMRPVEIAVRFGKNLLRARKRAGLSQEDVGFRASLHRTEIGMLERGTRLPRIDTLVKLAAAVEVEPGDLLEGLDWTAPPMPSIGAFSVREVGPDEPDPSLN